MNTKIDGLNWSYLNRLRQKRIPLICLFELTARCNLNCRHCFIRVEGKKYEEQELSLGQICDILSQMADAGVIYLSLTGGEPLLRPDFKEIYLFAKKKKFAVSVLTNATLLTQDTINLFKTHPPLTLEISNYGCTAEIYECITRTKGSFELFQNAIEMLKKTNIRILIKSVVMRSSYNKINLLLKDVINKSDMSCRYGIFFILRIDGDTLKNSIIKRERFRPSEVTSIFSSFKRDFLDEQKAILGHHDYIETCEAGTLACNITTEGKLRNCFQINEPSADLKKIKFAPAWNSIKLSKTPMEQKKIACGECKHKNYCFWCPGVAYLETGNPEKRVPYLCKVMQALNSNRASQKCRP